MKLPTAKPHAMPISLANDDYKPMQTSRYARFFASMPIRRHQAASCMMTIGGRSSLPFHAMPPKSLLAISRASGEAQNTDNSSKTAHMIVLPKDVPPATSFRTRLGGRRQSRVFEADESTLLFRAGTAPFAGAAFSLISHDIVLSRTRCAEIAARYICIYAAISTVLTDIFHTSLGKLPRRAYFRNI